jgi:hypothetical protein
MHALIVAKCRLIDDVGDVQYFTTLTEMTVDVDTKTRLCRSFAKRPLTAVRVIDSRYHIFTRSFMPVYERV